MATEKGARREKSAREGLFFEKYYLSIRRGKKDKINNDLLELVRRSFEQRQEEEEEEGGGEEPVHR